MRRRTAYVTALVAVVLVAAVMLLMAPSGEEEEGEREWRSARREGRFPCDEYEGRCLPQLIIAGLFKGGTSQLSYDLGLCHPEAVTFDRFGYEPQGIEQHSLKTFVHHLPKATVEDDKLLVVKMPKVAHYLPEQLEYLNEVMPSVRLVLMLRNPVDRDYSHFRMVLGRWGSRGMDGVQLPRNCLSDTNRCFFSIIIRYVLLADEEWHTCAQDIADSGKPMTDDVYGDLEEWEHSVAGITLGAWIECIHNIPKQDWRRKVVIVDQEYANRLRNLHEVFGRERVLVGASEDFFAGKDEFMEEVQEFAGLTIERKFRACTAALGSAKAEVEPKMEAAIGISVTPITPGVRALMNALHHLNVKEIEEYTEREFHWT